VRSAFVPPAPDLTGGSEQVPDGFGGPHTGVVHVAMLEGSVRRISYEIRHEVWRALCHRSDGTAIDPRDLDSD
jgi:hypothetical protein